MDYEKKYKEAIERAKEIIECSKSDSKEVRMVLSFFPELAESEDERIKEKTIATIHLYYGEPLEDEAKEMIAWLEKQGEHTAIPADAVLDSNKDGLIADTIRCKRENQCEQKHAEWSEEDEYCRHQLIVFCENCMVPDSGAIKCAHWLKSLKDRVQLQPKQAWSEEDEKIYQSIMDDTVQENQLDGKQTEWIRGIKERHFAKPQSTWKPSATDIRIFEQVIEGIANPISYSATLHVILEQLKILKG